MFKEKFSSTKLCRLALLIAVQVVLARFVSINTMGLRIGISFIPFMLAAYLYGPVSAGLVSSLADLIGAILFPFGPFHPGFTIMAFASGIVYGLLLDSKTPNNAKFCAKAVLAIAIHCLLIGLIINTIWVSQIYGSKTYGAWIIARLPEYFVMIPTQLVFAPIVKAIAKRIKNL